MEGKGDIIMYLGMKIFRLQQEAEEYEKEKRRLKLEEEKSGPLVYAIPFLMEYVLIPSEDIPRLKAYIRSSTFLGEALQKASKKGFPLYFQAFKRPFTNGEICGILNNVEEKIVEKKPILHCLHYPQVVHPAICIARNLIYPKKIPTSPYYLEAKVKMKEAVTKQEKRRLRRDLKKYNPILDPYPKCRSCIMGKKLIQKSCLGAEFDFEDEECTECPSKKECCQLMRLRIESILEGDEDEVKKDILKQWKELSQTRKEVRRDMAKKIKKKAEEVTEEVVEETTAPEKKKKTKAEKRADRRAAKKEEEKETTTEEEEEVPMTKAEKRAVQRKAKKEKESGPVPGLLKKLQAAKDDGDQDAARKIRQELRAAGYSLRAQAGK